jgi:WD repeat-containing protein 70
LPNFPITHEIILKDHTKVVSALALDPSGARIISGSHDYDCKLWDFGGMDARCKPFKTWEPAGSYYVSCGCGSVVLRSRAKSDCGVSQRYTM